ncbi:MAG TPA: GNAT family N-acetyltransferase [Actinomycetota bacterium]|nr:GNAT family N-acetyltransferase [Actinomycetota bacterium]
MTGEVRLRAVEPDDLPIYFENQLDPVAVEMAAFPARDREAFDAHWKEVLAGETNVALTVLVDDEVAGGVVSWVAEDGREVGYWLGRAFWGRGIATAALAALVEDLDERPLLAHVVTHNVGSIRVLEKCGFVPAGPPTMAEDGVEELLMVLRRT